jgi:hypothetical protein
MSRVQGLRPWTRLVAFRTQFEQTRLIRFQVPRESALRTLRSRQVLYRRRDSDIAAQKMSNALESQLNRFVTATEPYRDDADAFGLFVERIGAIRAQCSDEFVGLWSEDKPPWSQAGAETPAPIAR